MDNLANFPHVSGDDEGDALAGLVGEAFAAVLRKWLSAEQFAEMQRRNVDNAPCCASHDFCDSNMAMVEAFALIIGREPWLCSDVEEGRATEAQADDDLALFNAAWAHASARHLTAPAVAAA